MDVVTLGMAKAFTKNQSLKAGRGVSRVLTKLVTGKNITVSFIGDSGLEGNTVTTPGTDDCASLVCSTLSSRFTVTATKQNRAVSGYRAYSSMNPGEASPTKFSQALGDKADLYVLAFGHNDIRSGPSLGAAYLPGTGYNNASSMRAVEHMIRRIRIDVPSADIIVSNEWPYTGTSNGSNVDLKAHGNELRRLAAAYGCAFVDYYGTLQAKGVTGTTPTTDDVYVIPTGQTFAQHPNSAGHAVWANAILDLLPAGATPQPESPTLPVPSYGGEKYTHAGWVAMPVATNAVRTYRTSGYRLVGSWAGTSTLPQTSTTAGDYIDAQFIGSELVVRIDASSSAGHIKIVVDGKTYNADLNLTALGTGQYRFPLDVGPGIHRVLITVVSGTVIFRGLEYLPSMGKHIPYDSALLTYTGTWGAATAAAEAFNGNYRSTSTVNDTLTVEWVGTALWLNGYVYNAANIIGVTNDGGTETTFDQNSGGTAAVQGGWQVTSGLPYGRHTTVIRQASAGRAFQVSGLLAYDETRTERPRTLRGVTVAGESPVFPVALPGRPMLTLAPADATSAVPPYVTADTAAGFTANGTASAKALWVAETNRIAW
jgi:lysophospholipase L1-like esterase